MKNLFTVMITVALLFVACEKEDVFLTAGTTNVEASTQLVEEFVTELHNGLIDKEFRKAIFQALRQNDTKREVLLIDLLDSPYQSASNQQINTVRDFFITPLVNNGVKSGDGTDLPIDSLISIHPNLEVKLPDAWTDEEFDNSSSIAVSYHLDDADPLVYNTLSESGWSEIDATVPPSNPHAFIGVSEDHKLVEKGSPQWNDINCSACFSLGIEPIYESSLVVLFTSQDYYRLVDADRNGKYTGGGGVRPPGSGEGGSDDDDDDVVIEFRSEYPCEDADRETDDDKDNLFRLRFNNREALNDAFLRDNGWGNQDIELVATIFFQIDGQVSQITKNLNGIKKRWLRRNPAFGSYELLNYTANLEIFTWQDEINGSAMTYTWFEDDGGDQNGGSITTNLVTTVVDPDDEDNTITTTTMVSVPLRSRDEPIGSSIVEYCDETAGDGFEYNTGALIFSVNQMDR